MARDAAASIIAEKSEDYIEGRSSVVIPWFPVALTAMVAYALLIALFVAAYKNDVSALACINPSHVGTFPFETAGIGLGTANGYDGQFYYAVARDPWRIHGPNEIDLPARHVRILYPALAWLVSRGDPTALFWALPLVNILALGGLAGLGALLARSRGLSSWWGLLLPEAVCGGLTLLRDLTDLVSSLTISVMLVARLRNWNPMVLVIAAGGALFSREQNIFVVSAFLFVSLWERNWRTALGLAAVLILWGSWVLILKLEYEAWPILPSQGNLSQPFEGLRYACTHLGNTRDEIRMNLFCLLSLAGQVGLLAYLLRQRCDPALVLVGLTGLLLVCTAGESVYLSWWAYMRVQAWLPLALWLGFAGAGCRWPLFILALPGILPFYHTVQVLRHAGMLH
ncbi:MAG TPA: hypothetical protein VG097_12680 [Gemmata sp.]|jgi:hypothetical protein|nr:hypothetical protein [Gemmata sp.]